MNYKDFDAALKLFSQNHSLKTLSGTWVIQEPSSNTNFKQVNVVYNSNHIQLYAVDGIQREPIFTAKGACMRNTNGKECHVWKKHPDGLCFLSSNNSEKIIALEMKDNILSKPSLDKAFAQIASGLCNMKLLEYMCEGVSNNAECIGILVGTKTSKAEAAMNKQIQDRKNSGGQLKVSELLFRYNKATATIGDLNRNQDIPAYLASLPVSLRLELVDTNISQTQISI